MTKTSGGNSLHLERKVALFVSSLVYLWTACFGHAQVTVQSGVGTHGKKVAKAVRTELPVLVDGNLDEPAWEQAPVHLGFIQKDPQEGEPSTERTEFRVLYTATTLYIGAICYDSNPGGFRATERRRDDALENDDTITLVLDTFHDHRNAYLFRTNPLGTQYDALITDEGSDVNANWDEKWDSASRITEYGWTVEIAIPFKSLRLSEENGHLWGLDLERVIRRKNEISFWNNYRRGFNLQNVSQAGHLEGLENIESGLRFRVKPYLLGGFSHSSNQFDSDFDDASDIGIEVVKYRITSSLTADITWNTDFAQTEVDDQEVNLDRFPLFFPEKREFFLEGAGIFEFGLASSEAIRDMKLFHSRTIGLTPDRQPVRIHAGARLTGNLQGFTLGLMNVQTESLEAENLPARNYGVARIKRNVLARSTIGGFFLNRESRGSRDFNRVYGVDANFVFYRYLTISGLWGKSAQPGIKGQDWVSSGMLKWESDFLMANLDYAFVEPNFRDDLGFINRTDNRRITTAFSIRPRPNNKLIRQISLEPRIDYVTDRSWKLQTRIYHLTPRVIFQSGDAFFIAPHWRFERVKRPITLRQRVVEVTPNGKRQRAPVLVIPLGDYWWSHINSQYSANPARRLSGGAGVKVSPGYYGGDLVEWTIAPRLKLSNNFSVDLDYKINDFSFKQIEFLDHVVNYRINYNFNNQWLTTTTFQYNNANSFSGVNFRLNYIFRPGDDFFLVYNEGHRLGDVFRNEKDRSLQIKLTYSFDF